MEVQFIVSITLVKGQQTQR